MKSFLFTLGFLALFLTPRSQTYTHPTTGVASTYCGACVVSTCSGTYYDNGGAGGNYAANINNIYRTFCPNTPGMCVRAAFTSFSMNDTYFLCFGPSSCCDYLSILNGPAQNSTSIFSNCTSSPGTVTASNPSGCLTFRFVSDGSVQLAGWAANLSCVACAGGPTGTSNSDCINATPICSSASFNDASTGPGIVAEGCSGCNTSEVYTNWYRIRIATSGTLAFTIDPNINTDDFDVVVYGPGVTCASLGTPIRCTYAAVSGTGNTGLGGGALDNSEDVSGDQWVAPLNVTAGQEYYILINGWTPTAGSNGFNMSFTGTATFDCTILSAEIGSFTGKKSINGTELHWDTQVENNIQSFEVERLNSNQIWETIGGTSATGIPTEYFFVDEHPMMGSNKYRIRMLDNQGGFSYYNNVVEVNYYAEKVAFFPNPVKQGMTMEIESDDSYTTIIRIFNSTGQEVLSLPIEIVSGTVNQYQLNLSSLPAGPYWASMSGRTYQIVKE